MENLSQEKRKRMLEFLQQIRAEHKDDNSIIAINEIESELTSKKYGLVWEEHTEKVDEQIKHNVPVFIEVSDKIITSDETLPYNFLLEGDNLHSLKLLEKTHRGKIDLIYIDPPYNTGNKDFIYDDEYKSEDDGFRHSMWLSFMYERLKLARNLLSQEGAIFIQINDIEFAQLKMLCDDVFGEENFLNIISVNMKNIAGASGGGEDKRFKKNCEYILVYAKNYSLLPLFNGPYVYTEMSDLVQQYIDEGKSWKYTTVLIDDGEKEYHGSTIDGDGNEIKVYIRKNVVTMSINQVAKRDNITVKEAYQKYGMNVFRTTNAQSSIRTRIIAYRKENDLNDSILSIEYVPKTGKNKGQIYEQFYKDSECNLFVWLRDTSEVIDGQLYKKDLQGTYWDMTAGTKNLTKEGNVEFSKGKKPVALLQQIISLYPSKTATILDFFAGSGTTGHSVIVQNAEDGGTRKFILCTNNENNICEEKTYVRLSNVIRGYTTDKGKVFTPNPANLKYFKTDLIPKSSEDEEYSVGDKLLEHIAEMVELQHGTKIDNEKHILVLTDEMADGLTEEKLANCEQLYVSVSVLLTTEQERMFKKMGIEVLTIPDYYFESELLEVGER